MVDHYQGGAWYDNNDVMNEARCKDRDLRRPDNVVSSIERKLLEGFLQVTYMVSFMFFSSYFFENFIYEYCIYIISIPYILPPDSSHAPSPSQACDLFVFNYHCLYIYSFSYLDWRTNYKNTEGTEVGIMLTQARECDYLSQGVHGREMSSDSQI